MILAQPQFGLPTLYVALTFRYIVVPVVFKVLRGSVAFVVNPPASGFAKFIRSYPCVVPADDALV